MSRISDELDAAIGPTRLDGWFNALTHVGVSGKDKRKGNEFAVDPVSKAEAQEIWRGDALGARIVETWPNEMLREGFKFSVQTGEDEDAERAKDIETQVGEKLEELEVEEELHKVLSYERGYGGGAILLGVNDGQKPDQPLNVEGVVSFDYIISLEPDELSPERYYQDVLKPKFGKPETWRINPKTEGGVGATTNNFVEVHESRLIIFEGARVSRSQSSLYKGFGDSIFTRVKETLSDYNMSFSSASLLLQDFAQAVFKMKGLAAMIALDKDDILQKRMMAVDMSRSIARAIFIDADSEEFERKQTPVSGLPELLDKMGTRLAADVDIPLTLLLGISPGGLNSTGESDIRFFYDRVKSKQSKKLKQAYRKIIELCLAAAKVKDTEWSCEPNPLWQETQTEIVTRRKVQAETDAINISNGILHPEEVVIARFGGDEYSHETTIDMEARAELEDAEAELDARAEEKAAAMALENVSDDPTSEVSDDPTSEEPSTPPPEPAKDEE